MSSSVVTFEVPRAENETVFLLCVVQAALKAYRNTPMKNNKVTDAPSLSRVVKHMEN
jgi:hypothetical protein